MPPIHRKGDRSLNINTTHHNSEDLSMTCNLRNMHSAIRFFKIVTSTNIQDGTLVTIFSFISFSLFNLDVFPDTKFK